MYSLDEGAGNIQITKSIISIDSTIQFFWFLTQIHNLTTLWPVYGLLLFIKCETYTNTL